MKKILLIIVVEIMISIMLYGIFAFSTWEFNPKYWDIFLRGVFSIILIIVTIFCGIVVYCEIED